MNRQTLQAADRTILGRRVKSLRANGELPANIYGNTTDSVAITINTKEFNKVYSITGETGLIDIMIAEQKRPVLVHNVTYDSMTQAPLHVDLHQVNLKEKVTANVPVEVEGESPAEKQGLGTVVQHLNEVEVEALPTDLPEKFVVDTSVLSEVDQAIYVKDLKVDISVVTITNDPDAIVVKVETQKEEPVEEVVTEGEVPADGATPAETTDAASTEDTKQE
jgi:large subunit ribosomal protein L25